MAKHRKGAANTKSHSNTQTTVEGKLSQNGTEKKDPHKAQGHVQKSGAPAAAKNKLHVSEHQQKKIRSAGGNSRSSVKCWLALALLTIGVAVCGVVFMNEIQEVAESTFRLYIQPQVPIFQRMVGSDSENAHETQESITLDEETKESRPSPTPFYADESEDDAVDIDEEESQLSSSQVDDSQNSKNADGIERSNDETVNNRDNHELDDKIVDPLKNDITNSKNLNSEAPPVIEDISVKVTQSIVANESRIQTEGDGNQGPQVDLPDSATVDEHPEKVSNIETSYVEDFRELEQKDSAIQPEVPDRTTYIRSSITNEEDFQIYKELDEADELLEKENLELAIEKYDAILRKHTLSPRAHYGKGLTLDKLGFKYMSNDNLERAIDFLARVLELPSVPDELQKLAGRKLADRQQFRGWGGQAVKTLKTLIQRFPEDLNLRNELGVSYLMVGHNDRARDVFKEVLAKDSANGFAKAHLGFIVKTQDNDLERAVELLSEGIRSGAPGTADGRFYLQLGDSLLRLGHESEARKFFQEGQDKGLFLSAWQRSLYNVDRLTGRPWWSPEQTPYQEYLKMLQDNWKVIRDEGLAQLNAKTGSFVPEEENLRDTGDWKQFTLYQQGRKKTENCDKAPETCKLIDRIPDARGCKRGQVKFSVMSPGIHVWPHVGPTNCRIRAHLGLVVPEGPIIRVMNETRTWKEGEFIIFDDSFEHEVWHEGSELRLVLIVDFWHPELTEAEKRRLSAI